MKTHEKKWTHEGPCKYKVFGHAQIYQKGETKNEAP